jgi:hypothetical protein
MILIQAREKMLSFHGDTNSALNLVNSLREAYDGAGLEMSKMLNDFVFNLEVALQNEGILDENFNERGEK